MELSGLKPASFDSSISFLSSSASTGSSEGFIGRAGIDFAETARAEEDSDRSDKEDAESDPDCGFNFGGTGVVSSSSIAECISIVRAGAESVAAETEAGTNVGTKLGAVSAKRCSCEETDPAAAPW